MSSNLDLPDKPLALTALIWLANIDTNTGVIKSLLEKAEKEKRTNFCAEYAQDCAIKLGRLFDQGKNWALAQNDADAASKEQWSSLNEKLTYIAARTKGMEDALRKTTQAAQPPKSSPNAQLPRLGQYTEVPVTESGQDQSQKTPGQNTTSPDSQGQTTRKSKKPGDSDSKDKTKQTTAGKWEEALPTAIKQVTNLKPDYAKTIENTWNTINRSAEDHWVQMLTGAENFSQGMKSIYKDMGKSIEQMMATLLYQKVFYQPVNGLFTDIADWIGNLIPKKRGGDVLAGQAYIVGEERPEIFVPRTEGTIIPNVNMLGGGAPSLQVVVNNNTGSQVRVRKEQPKFDMDSRRWVATMFIDAYVNDVEGLRSEVLGAR